MDLQNIKDMWQNKTLRDGESRHIYLHTPFCVGVCNYCMYNSVDMIDSNKKEYDKYFHGLLSQIRDFKDILTNNPTDSIYFGGGTPSIMPFEVLKQIAGEIPHWDDIKVKVFEANPVSTTKDKIDVLSQLGFTYLAFGVQTLDGEELKRQNRKPPRNGHLKEITQYALEKGMHVNYDIMTLLNDNLEEDMERVYCDLMTIMKEYKPPSIDIYPMDQKLNNISHEEVLKKIKALRRTIAKASYFNKDYHISGGMGAVSLDNSENILRTCKENYHLLNIPDNVFFGERKAYSCSGPGTAPMHQNVISFGGYRDSWVYSYSADREFVYYTQLDEDGNVKYAVRRGYCE